MSKQPKNQYGFIEEQDENPFEDTAPAPVAAAPAAGGVNKVTSSVKNMFSSLTGKASSSSTPGAAAPAVGAAAAPADEVALREANLKAREDKMRQKELEVERREKQVKAAEGAQNNWPCKCYPIAYHSIPDEIPESLQPMMKRFYALLLFTWLCLLWNLVALIVVWGESGDGGTDPVWGAVYLVLGVPGSWSFWYRSVYYGAKRNASRKYLVFFCSFFVHIVFFVIVGLGVPSMGGAGLMVAIKEFAKGYPASGVFSIIQAGLYCLNFLVSLYLLKKARDAWRTGGGSEALAKDSAKLKLAAKAAST